MSLRFSLRDLLILIALVAIACAALSQPGEMWHSVVVSVSLLMLVGMLLRVLMASGEQRAFAAGWLLFATSYLLILFGPWSGTNHLGQNLITSIGLNRLEAAWRPGTPPVVGGARIVDANGDGGVDINWGSGGVVYWDTADVMRQGVIGTTQPTPTFAYALTSTGSTITIAPSNCSVFFSTGHWLLSSAYGYLGAMLGVAMYRLGQRKPAT